MENGVPAGNYYNKYETRNPIERHLVASFLSTILELADRTGAAEVHEVGCGEGHLTRIFARKGLRIRGSDVSEQVILRAGSISEASGLAIAFKHADIYSLREDEDAAPLILCIEVLEHLERPGEALQVLARLARPHLLISVPREPLWRMLNLCRGKYVKALGNTPGHLQHWSRKSLVRLLDEQFEVLTVAAPVPWVMALCRTRQHG